jgi:hypothetical protein
MRRLLSLAVGALCALSPAVCTTAAVAAGPTGESWFVVRIGETAVGTASERWSSDRESILFHARMSINFTRMGTPLTMSVLAEETCDARGRFQSARMESSVSNMSASAVLVGDSVRYESRAGGSTHRRVVAWDPAAVTEVRARECIRAWLKGAEAETTVTIFDIADGMFHRQRLLRGESVRMTVAGAERTLTKVDEFDDDAGAPASTTWYAEDGEGWRTLVRQLGIEILIERVTADELATLEIESSFDIIRHSMVRCAGFPTPVSRMQRVTLSLEFAVAPPRAPMDGPNQIEVSRDERSVQLALTRESARHETAERADLEPFLRADRFVQSDDPVLRAVVDSLRNATGTGGWPLARAVAAFVNRHIAHKGMEHGYDSALDVYRTRAGDCTEHSLLAVALLRAAGIPARPVVGLAYGAPEQAFVGHMWVEAYVDYWRTLDALDLALDPIRIRVHAPQSDESLGERSLMRAYGEVAGVTVRVVDHRSN